MAIVVAGATLWWARPLLEEALLSMGWLRPSSTVARDVIPSAFRGTWIEHGAECGEAEAEAHVDRSSVNYDRLSFIADTATWQGASAVKLSGRSFRDGDPRDAIVELRVDGPGHLSILSNDLASHEGFDRCA
jgi:hypothetical protein